MTHNQNKKKIHLLYKLYINYIYTKKKNSKKSNYFVVGDVVVRQSKTDKIKVKVDYRSLSFLNRWKVLDETCKRRIFGSRKRFFFVPKQKIHWIWWLICQNNSLSQWKIFPVCEHEKLFRFIQIHTHTYKHTCPAHDTLVMKYTTRSIYCSCYYFIQFFLWINEKKSSFGIPTIAINAWENHGWNKRSKR